MKLRLVAFIFLSVYGCILLMGEARTTTNVVMILGDEQGFVN